MTPPMGGNCIPLMFQRFTVAILKIETRSENKKCSICPQITFSFSDLDYLTPPPALTRGLNRGRMGSSCFRWMKTVFMNIPNHFLRSSTNGTTFFISGVVREQAVLGGSK